VLQASSFDSIRDAVSRGRKTPLASLVVNAGASDDSVVLTTLNIDVAEAQLIERALRVTGGNRTRAAELLGLTDRTLRNKLARQRESPEKKH